MRILKNWKAILAIVLVFVAGIVTGVVLSCVHFKHALERGFTVENWTTTTMGFLQKDLNLTPKQEPKVRAIVQETGEQFRQTFGQAIGVSGTNLVASWQRIDQLLTPEQRIVYHRKCQEFREKLKQGLKVELPPDPAQKEPAMSLRLESKVLSGNEARGRRRTWAALAGALLIVTLLGGSAALQNASTSTVAATALDADHLYDLTNVWTIHLKFTPDQWEAMEPEGGFNPFGGGPPGGGPGGPRGDAGGRPGGRPGGFGGFGGISAAKTLTPVFMSQADLNRDGGISREEFATLAQKWFKTWDTDGTGTLDEKQIRAGLNKIHSPGGGLGMMLQGPEGKRNGLSSAMGIEFGYVHADLEFEGRLVRDVGVRYKGNGTFMESRDSLKRSLKIDLNKYAKGQGLGNVKMLTLQNNVTDASLMNEVLAYRLYRDAGVPSPRTAYARAFVTVPGKFDRKYFGLYSLSESIDKQFAQRHFGTKRGAIFKPVTPSLFSDLGADWAAYNQTYDPKVVLYDEQKKSVMDLSRLVTQADDAEFAAHIGEHIDLPEFARYMAVMVYLSDLDGILGPGQNFFLHLDPRTQLFQFIPWDQDHSWGQFARASQDQRDKLSIQHPWQGDNLFLERMLKLEAFKKLYLARLDEFSKTIFKPERLAQQVDEIAAAIRPAVQEESESKLAQFDKVVAGENLAARGFGPFGGGETKPIKPFTKARTESVREQLAGKSEGLLLGNGFPGGGPGGGDGSGELGGSGLGMMLGQSFLKTLDENKDGSVTQAEFTQGFTKLFEAWNSDQSGRLTLAQLRSGIDKDLPRSSEGFSPFGGGPPGGRGFPPPDRPPGQGFPPPEADQKPPP